MKKQLLSILALMLCLCTIFVFSACGKQNELDASDSESLNESGSGEGEFDVEDGLTDVDEVTAEDIFAQMKEAYKATLDYKNAYAVNVNWVEDHNETEIISDADSESKPINTKISVTQNYTADPTTGKAALVYSYESLENNQKTADADMFSKVFTENGKNYIYESSKTDGILEYEQYNTLSDYGLSTHKSDSTLSTLFTADSHFYKSFGDPFAASSASDLKSIYTSVLNEVKNNQKAIYEAEGYTVKTLTAKADIIFNKDDGVNILKRTVKTTADLANNGGTFKKELTVESLLKTKDGKILSFVSTTTMSTIEKVGETYGIETEVTSSLSYDLSYALNNSTFSSIKTSVPAAGVVDAPDYFESPLTLVVGGNEMTITIQSDLSAENSISEVLNEAINGIFADANIDFDGKWYTDAACTKEFDVSSVTTIEKLKAVTKLYNSGIKVSSDSALFIDSGKEVVNLPKNYTIVFGSLSTSNLLETTIEVKTYDEENHIHRISYEANNPEDVSITLNGTALKYDSNLENSDFQEESAGEFFHEFSFESGKIYYINRTNTINKSFFTLDSFFVGF